MLSKEYEFSYQNVHGLDLRVMDTGEVSDEPPLIVCNGLSQSCETIQPLFDEMEGRRLISFDAAGAGKSETSTKILSMPDHARLVAGLLDRLEIGQADIMGISWGGMLAQQFVIDHPERCRKLVLAITSVGGPITLSGNPAAAAEIFFATRRSLGRFSKRWRTLMAQNVYGAEAFFRADELSAYSERNVTAEKAGYYGQLAALLSWTSLPSLHKIAQPTLVYSGLYDPLIPFWNQQLLAAMIPNAELRTLNTGHWLVYSKRELIAKEITQFLS